MSGDGEGWGEGEGERLVPHRRGVEVRRGAEVELHEERHRAAAGFLWREHHREPQLRDPGQAARHRLHRQPLELRLLEARRVVLVRVRIRGLGLGLGLG